MSDVSQGPGWWQASDGKWYPPRESDEPPGPGWWLASDGKWYPPELRSASAGGSGAAAVAAHTRAVTGQPRPSERPTSGGQPKPAGGPSRSSRATGTATGRKAGGGSSGAGAAKSSRTSGAQTGAKGTGAPPSTNRPARTAPARSAAITGGAPAPPTPRRKLDPLSQFERRNAASREDAAVLAPKRAAAASRALATLRAELEAAKAAASQGVGPAQPAMTTPASGPSSSVQNGKGTPSGAPVTRPAAPVGRASGGQQPHAGDGPLLEVKPSPLASDLERLGERLAIFNDRVELRDRNDRVRQVIRGEEITDVVVHKKLTGAVLSIENVDGPAIVAKGLRPEQADEARNLIMKKTRPAGPVDRNARVSRPAQTAPVNPAPPPRPRHVDEADLLRKLGDLHRAGILTDEEYEEKIDLVGRLVRGEDLSPTPT